MSLLQAGLSRRSPAARPTPTALHTALTRATDPDATVAESTTITMVSSGPAERRDHRARHRRSTRSEYLFVGVVGAIVAVAAVVAMHAIDGSRGANRAATSSNQATTLQKTARGPSTAPAPSASQLSTRPTERPAPGAPEQASPPLIDSGFGFLVPKGWSRQPLIYPPIGGGVVARYDDLPGQGAIFYIVSGGESGSVYNSDGTVNLRGALGKACVNSSAIASFAIGTDAIGYSCEPSIPGTGVNGVVIVDPSKASFTWKKLEVTLPANQRSLATRILNSFTAATS